MFNDFQFPHAESADKQGLVYIGGDLNSERVLSAYAQGIFPWYEPGSPVLWWSPNPRLVIYPDKFHLTRSLKKSLRDPSYRITFDTAFSEVIQACASVDDRTGATWITPEMINTYTELFHQGYGHSIEVWKEGRLIGGLYGLSLGRTFFGESMFHLEPDASKIALYTLCQWIKERDFDFVDCQLSSAHLLSLGGTLMKRKEYLHHLTQSLVHETILGPWEL